MSSQWECDKCTFLNSDDDLTCTMCFQVRASTRSLPYTWQWLAQVDWITYDSPSNEQIEAAFQRGDAKVDLNQGWFKSKRGEYTVHFGRRPAPQAAKQGRARESVAAARRAARRAPADDSDDDEQADGAGSSSDEEGAADASASSAAAGAGAAGTQPARATVPAFTQVNNHSRMVRKVRRLADDDDDMFVVLPPSAVERGMKCGICAEEWWEMEEEEQASGTTDASAAAPSSDARAAASTSLPASSSASSSSSSASSAAPSSSVATCVQLYPSDEWPESAQACVKLAKCAPGHACHRSCIAQWVKLKDHCPTCATKI